MSAANQNRWEELMPLLAPIHDQARLLARRVARCNAEGDDLFQEAVLRALDKLPALRDRDRFRPWFYRILLSQHRSRYRRGFWRRFLSLEPGTAAEVAGDDGVRSADERAGAARAARALATLPAAQREAVVLAELLDCSLEEIAEIQQASLPAVKSRVSRGREALRRYYRRIGAHPSEAPEDPSEYSNAV
jgi:RNA polymerase sigma-70 factor, ECF subfamily